MVKSRFERKVLVSSDEEDEDIPEEEAGDFSELDDKRYPDMNSKDEAIYLAHRFTRRRAKK